MRILLLFILFPVIVISQEPTLLSGKVLTAKDDVEGVNIINQTSRVGTVTDVNGNFSIPVRMADSLRISAVQFAPQTILITEDILEKGAITIVLKPSLSELQEVTISDGGLTGDIKKDMDGVAIDESMMGYEPNYLPARKRRFTVEERKLYTATTRGADQVGQDNLRLDFSFDKILNGLSGKTKKLKKHLKTSQYEKRVVYFKNKFGNEMYVQTLKIPVDYIDDFIFWLLKDKEAFEELDLENELEVIDFLLQKAPQYRALKANEKKKVDVDE